MDLLLACSGRAPETHIFLGGNLNPSNNTLTTRIRVVGVVHWIERITNAA